MSNSKIYRCYIIYVLLGLVYFPQNLEHGTGYMAAVSVCPTREITPDVVGSLSSPGYPNHYYDKNLHCELVLKVPPSKQIRLAFSEVDIKTSLNCTKDSLSITNNQWSKSEARETRYCGRYFPLKWSVKTVTRTFPNRQNNTDVVVRFTTDEYGTGAGFLLRYELNDKPLQEHGSKCFSALGMEDGRIKNSQIKVSSVKQGTIATGQQARLSNNHTIWAAWCPENTNNKGDFDQYIQINLLRLTKLTRIGTQGREYNDATGFAKKYKVSYSKDGHNWIDYLGNAIFKTDTRPQIFRGNSDAKSVVINDLNPPVTAKYVRIHPDYDQLNLVCMRLELYGCLIENGNEVVAKDPNTNKQNVKTIATLVGVSLFIILIALMVILKYRRRRLAKPSTRIRIEIENGSSARTSQAAQIRPMTVNETRQQNAEQKSGYMIPLPAKIVPYKVIKIPPNTQTTSGCTELGVNTLNVSLNDDNHQKSLRRESGYVIPAEGATYEEVYNNTHSGYTEIDINALHDSLYDDNNPKLLKRESGYVIPAESNTCEEIYSNTPSGYTELDNTTRQSSPKEVSTDGRYQHLVKRESGYVIPAHDGSEAPYHNDQAINPSGYTELDKNKRIENETNDGYQKLLKNNQGYEIPNHGKPKSCEVQAAKPTSGYTELDISKRVLDDNSAYQKLIKQ